MKNLILIILLASLFIMMTISIIRTPTLGEIDNPSNNYAYNYYTNNTIDAVNAPNIISAIITDYRAFDTLGEMIILFASIAAIMSVSRFDTKKRKGISDK